MTLILRNVDLSLIFSVQNPRCLLPRYPPAIFIGTLMTLILRNADWSLTFSVLNP